MNSFGRKTFIAVNFKRDSYEGNTKRRGEERKTGKGRGEVRGRRGEGEDRRWERRREVGEDKRGGRGEERNRGVKKVMGEEKRGDGALAPGRSWRWFDSLTGARLNLTAPSSCCLAPGHWGRELVFTLRGQC